MRFTILFLFFSSLLYGQIEQSPAMLVSSLSVISSSAPNYTVQGSFSSQFGYTRDSIQEGVDVMWLNYTISNPDRPIRAIIDSFTVISGNTLRFYVELLDGESIAAFPTGTASIYRPTPSYGFILEEPNESNTTKAQKNNANILLIEAAITAAGNEFDSDRTVLRAITAGVNIGGSTVTDVLEYMYFTPPTITLTLSPTTTVYEVGDSAQIILSGATTNPGAATLSAGYLTQTAPSADTLKSFTSATSYADTISFTPQQGGSGQFNTLAYSFRATQAWVKAAESGTATSTTRSISGVYPVLYGMSATDFTSTGNPYTGLTKLVEAEGDKTVTLTGSGFIYFLVPKTWTDWNLSSIIDHNGFNVTASFTAIDINISSSGLTNNWSTQDYRMYKLNTTTTTSGNAYQFNR